MIKRPMPLIAPFIAVLAAANAQYTIDTFTNPAGTVIPGWTEQRGNWAGDGSLVLAQSG